MLLVPAVLAVVLIASLSSGGASAAAPTDSTTSRVLYVTEGVVYIDAGREKGLREGDMIQIVRGDSVVAVAHVTALSSRGAACVRMPGAGQVAPGDVARFAERNEARLPESIAQSARGRVPRRASNPRGRIGVRMLAIRDGTEPRSDIYQPSIDARINGALSDMFAVEVDLRARQTYRPQAEDGSRNLTRVHRLAVVWQRPNAPLRLTAGRLSSPSLATVSVFDGGLAEYRRKTWSLGLFSGTQPEPETYGLDMHIREHGGYAELRGSPGGRGRYVLTAGVIGSYQKGRINREFGFLQARYLAPRFSAHWAQELDANRSWKADAGEPALSPTSTFASARYRAFEALSFSCGYDNRRNVRLYRDQVTPETEFDDSYRQGVSGGAEVRVSRYSASAATRFSRGVSSEKTESHTFSAEARSVTRIGFTIGGRSTRFASSRAEGWLHSGHLAVPLAGTLGADVETGIRDEHARQAGLDGSRLVWTRADLTAAIGRRWFGIISVERDAGAGADQMQIYTSLSYRL
jgi:hypothetical protein